jgi:hypothetical protein
MRKQKIPNQLQNLTGTQLSEFHAWFPKFSYPQISAKLRALYGVDIGTAQLCRYYQRLEDASALSEGVEKPLTVPEYLAVQNGDPLLETVPNADALKRQCLKLAARPDQDAADLLNLFRVFTYDQRRGFAERRLEILKRTNQLRERRLALKAHEAARLSPAQLPVDRESAESKTISFPHEEPPQSGFRDPQ